MKYRTCYTVCFFKNSLQIGLFSLLLSSVFLSPDIVFADEASNEILFKKYKKAASLGDRDAHYRLAYSFGGGKMLSKEGKFFHYLKAAELGHLVSMYAVGLMKLNANGTQRDIPGVIKWMNKAGDNGHPGGYLLLGSKYGKQGKDVFSIDLQKSANYYEKCIGLDGITKVSPGESKYHLKKCYTNLGIYYLHGTGVSKDLSKARNLFSKGVELGEPIAMYYLAFNYINGEGGKPDFYRGVELLNQAADKGLKNASESLKVLEEMMNKKLRKQGNTG